MKLRFLFLAMRWREEVHETGTQKRKNFICATLATSGELSEHSVSVRTPC